MTVCPNCGSSNTFFGGDPSAQNCCFRCGKIFNDKPTIKQTKSLNRR